MVMAKPRDWTLDHVEALAKLAWETYQRERLELGVTVAYQNRISTLKNIQTEAITDGHLDPGDVGKRMKALAAKVMATQHT